MVLKRRAARHGELAGEDVATGAEALARDWASGNGSKSGPAIEELPMQPGDPTVTTRTWTAPGCRPVTLYRIDGGGHGWPGGPQFLPVLPARIIGQIPRHLDATGILPGMAEREDDANSGRRILGPGSRA